jgi:hypothetical protein
MPAGEQITILIVVHEQNANRLPVAQGMKNIGIHKRTPVTATMFLLAPREYCLTGADAMRAKNRFREGISLSVEHRACFILHFG